MKFLILNQKRGDIEPMNYQQLAKQYVDGCTVNGKIQYGTLEDAYEMVPKILGIDMTLAQHERFRVAVDKELEKRGVIF